MQNVHERFGMLEFTTRMKDKTTRLRVHVDCAKRGRAVQGKWAVRFLK